MKYGEIYTYIQLFRFNGIYYIQMRLRVRGDWLSDFYHLANFFISIAPLPLFWSRLDLPVILLNGSQHFDFLIILVENRVQMCRQ